MIDLRSDTVTKPTPGMLQAMMQAAVGDDVIDIDPTVVQLQEKVASMLRKEAAIFMPSGTMTNQIALRAHCSPGHEFICETECHIYNYEQGAFAQLSSLVAKTIPGTNGILKPEQLLGTVRGDNEHTVRTRLICLENTHNRGGGTIYPIDYSRAICKWAAENGLVSHLDGARLFNAAVATGISVGDYSGSFDSVSVCFSKGLGAPIGSCLAGTKEFVAKARRARKLFGGGMRQVGYLAAAALYALENQVERLAIDHQHARQLADSVRKGAMFHMTAPVETNIVIFHVDPTWGTAAKVVELLRSKDVLAIAFGPQSIRLVTHLDVSESQIETACAAIEGVAK